VPHRLVLTAVILDWLGPEPDAPVLLVFYNNDILSFPIQLKQHMSVMDVGKTVVAVLEEGETTLLCNMA